MVKAAGVVGMGGAGFPTGVKLGTDLEGGYILINAAECEPGLRHNIQQIEEECDKVIRGVKYSMEISNAAKAIFAIKKKNTKAVQTLKEALKDEPAISIHLLPDIYPMGEERAVVRECLESNLIRHSFLQQQNLSLSMWKHSQELQKQLMKESLASVRILQ